MEDTEAISPSGYAKLPWLFKGRALYQLHLVKVETARAFIPREFRLVEAFGYTLGGFFLASYDDSPAGIFDELVVIAGLVWNPPTSCAWASRVLVNSEEACIHGRKDVGLPSQFARFSKRISAIPKSSSESRTHRGFLNMVGIGGGGSSYYSPPKNTKDIEIREMNKDSTASFCTINLVTSATELNSKNWMGPLIKMSLPSFSGRTEYNPNLLKYSCQIECRVRAVPAAKISAQTVLQQCGGGKESSEEEESRRKMSKSVMMSKPILALEFSCLKMVVEPPVVVLLPPPHQQLCP